MELKCSHCNEVFKKNDLDKTSKKELENYLKEIEKSLYLKLKKEITKKYKEELKQVEAEKKEMYSHLKRLENEIGEDIIDPSLELKRLRNKIDVMKAKKEALIMEIRKLRPGQKEYTKWVKRLNNARKPYEETMNVIKAFLQDVKKLIVGEISNFYTNLQNLDESYLTSVKSRIKKMDGIVKTNDELDACGVHPFLRDIYNPIHSSIIAFISCLLLDEIYLYINSFDEEDVEKLYGIFSLFALVEQKTLFSRLKKMINKLEKDYPWAKVLMAKRISSINHVHRSFLLDELMKMVIRLYEDAITKLYSIRHREIEQKAIIDEYQKFIDENKNMIKKIEQLKMEYVSLKKEKKSLYDELKTLRIHK